MSIRRFLAVAGGVLLLFGAGTATPPARAAVPNRVFGTVTLNGQPAPVGTTIVAQTAGKQCASTSVVATAISGTSYPYTINIPDGSASAECTPGAVVVFTVGGVIAGQTVTLDDIGSFVRADLTAPGTPNVPVTTSSVSLTADCTRVTSSFPDGTPAQIIAQAVTPANALIAIWRFDAAANVYHGYSPATSFASDLNTVNRNDALRICTSAAATLAQPS